MISEKSVSRRGFLRVAGLTAGAAALAACAPAAAPAQAPAQQQEAAKATEAPAQAPAAAAEPTTVKLLTTHGASMAPFIEKSLANFATAHPEVKVDHEDLTEGYYDRLNVMLASNTLPDVVNLRSFDMYDWFRLGNLHNVSDFLDLEPNIKPESMVDAIMKSCYFEGKYWGMPYDASVVINFYDKDMFAKAGVEEPKDTWTMDEMLQVAQSMTKEGETYGISSMPVYAGWMAEPWFLANGAHMVNEARDEWTLVGPEAEETFQWLIDLRNKHKVVPAPQAQGDINLFVVGKGAQYFSGQWEIPGNRDALKFAWDVAAFPSGKDGHHPITHGGTYIMYAKTKVPDAAWKVQRWITAEEDWQMNVYGASGYSIPALKSVAEKAWMAPIKEGKPPARAQVVLDELAKAVPGALWPNYWKINDIMVEEMDKAAVTGDSDVKTALETVKKRADAAIQEALAQGKSG
jgi:multiple sugar transport system substrate-binding protein